MYNYSATCIATTSRGSVAPCLFLCLPNVNIFSLEVGKCKHCPSAVVLGQMSRSVSQHNNIQCLHVLTKLFFRVTCT